MPAEKLQAPFAATAKKAKAEPVANVVLHTLNRAGRLALDAVMITVFSPVILAWWLSVKWQDRTPRS